MSALGPVLWQRRRRVLLFVILLFFTRLLLRLPTVGDILAALHTALLAAFFLLLVRVPVRDRRKPVGPLLREKQSAISNDRQRFKKAIKLKQIRALDKWYSPGPEEDCPP